MIDPRLQGALDRLEDFRLTAAEIRAIFSDSVPFTGQNDLRIPVMPQGRARSAAGGVSFHFKGDVVSRKGVPLLDGKPHLAGGAAAREAHKFEAYLRRHDAAETVRPGQDTYISRSGAVAALTEEEAEAAGGFPPIISNISDVAAEREEYWATVWKHLKPPKTNYLVVRPSVCPEFWDALDERSPLPPKLLAYLLSVRQALRDHQSRPSREKFKPSFLEVSAEEAGAFLAAVRQAGRGLQPVLFKSGRGGRHQYQMAIELPHVLPPPPVGGSSTGFAGCSALCASCTPPLTTGRGTTATVATVISTRYSTTARPNGCASPKTFVSEP